MGLVTAKEIAKAVNVDKLGLLGTFAGWSLLKVLKISTMNKIYDRNKHLNGLSFINALLEEFEINFETPGEDLKRIPKTGPFITISNHPLGGIDGILLLKILLEHRPDFKIIANFLLHRVAPLKPFVMPVNPFESHKKVKNSYTGFKAALSHLQEGRPLGLFPAGEVSTHKEGSAIVDKPWETAAIKLIKKAKAPIVPIYFHAKNSGLFYR
ncbi:MAG: GNAT family N-acetyltransferase, partial [Marinirhabdus sp.]